MKFRQNSSVISSRDQHPLISICIPTYNGAEYLNEALDSVHQQTYKNIEVVISDNLSTDGTVEIIREFLSQAPFPVTFVSHDIIGIGTNWNNCIQNSKGEFIKFLFQDDVLSDNCIEKLIEPFSAPSIGMSYCNKMIIGDSQPSVQAQVDALFQEYAALSATEILKHKNFFRQPRNKIGEPSCVLIKKTVFNRVGLFNTHLNQSLDYEFYYRVFKHYEIAAVNQKLVKFRVHKSQATEINSKEIIVDSYLLPFLMMKNHFWSLHFNTQVLLLYKLMSGGILYFVSKTFNLPPMTKNHNKHPSNPIR